MHALRRHDAVPVSKDYLLPYKCRLGLLLATECMAVCTTATATLPSFRRKGGCCTSSRRASGSIRRSYSFQELTLQVDVLQLVLTYLKVRRFGNSDCRIEPYLQIPEYTHSL